MPANFWIIVLVQFLLFMAFAISFRKSGLSFLRFLLLSAGVGIIIGIIFDLLNGILGIHGYLVHNDSPVYALLPFWPFIMNGALSYGLAVATAFYIDIEVEGTLERKKFLSISIVWFVISLILLIFFGDRGVATMFAAGLFIISASELALILTSDKSLLSYFIAKENFGHTVLLWLKIAIIGMFYEIINHFYPFWSWLPRGNLNPYLIEFLIIIFGYFVLFYPMLVFWQLLGSKNNKN